MSKHTGVLFLVAIFWASAVSAAKGEVIVICANGMRETMRGLHEELEHATGQKVIMTFDEAGNLWRSLQAGPAAEVIILPT